MARHTRAELVAEIAELQRQQLKSFTDGTLSGWPRNKKQRTRNGPTVLHSSS
jgi:hypothetical protein